MGQTIDYLEEDQPIAGQKYFLKSFIKGPDGTVFEKIRYVCGTSEDGERTAQRLIEEDDTFDIFMGEVGKWLPVEGNMDNSGKVEYQNEKLNEVMKQYKQNQEDAKAHFKERTAKIKRDGYMEHLENEERIAPGPGPSAPLDERRAWEMAPRTDVSTSVIDVPVGRSKEWKAVC